MGRPKAWPPRTTKRRGNEYIRVYQDGARREVLLGPVGSDEARQEYARIVAEMTACDGRLPVAGQVGALVATAAVEWLARSREDDPRTFSRRRRALDTVIELYGPKPLANFGPLCLKACRERWNSEGLARRYVNHLALSVKQWFRWCLSEQLVPPAVAWTLWQLDGLRKGKGHRETPKIRPVPLGLVRDTLPHLQPIVADMVRLQLLTGARPGEVCALRGCDIDRHWQVVGGVAVWLYKLDEHKTDWRGHLRWIPIGPQAQALLAPYLEGRDPQTYLFSPAESRKRWEAEKAAKRKIPPSQGNRPGTNRKARPKRKAGERYTTQSYGRSIKNVCERVGLEPWAPNQLRHRVGTDVETNYSREDARCVLGHSTPQTTAIYAEQVERAARVIAKIG